MKIKTTEFINHGVVNVGDLPIPFDMVLNASTLVVVITFVYLKISWKESIVVPVSYTHLTLPTKRIV